MQCCASIQNADLELRFRPCSSEHACSPEPLFNFWRVIHPRSETGSKDDTSKVPADRNSDPARVSAETSPAEGDRKFPTRSALTRLERAIEAQRAQLLQAHGVLTCLYEVLLYAEGDDAINYAQAAHAAVRVINNSVEDLDSLHIRPLIDEIVFKSGVRVEDSSRNYWG